MICCWDSGFCFFWGLFSLCHGQWGSSSLILTLTLSLDCLLLEPTLFMEIVLILGDNVLLSMIIYFPLVFDKTFVLCSWFKRVCSFAMGLITRTCSVPEARMTAWSIPHTHIKTDTQSGKRVGYVCTHCRQQHKLRLWGLLVNAVHKSQLYACGTVARGVVAWLTVTSFGGRPPSFLYHLSIAFYLASLSPQSPINPAAIDPETTSIPRNVCYSF